MITSVLLVMSRVASKPASSDSTHQLVLVSSRDSLVKHTPCQSFESLAPMRLGVVGAQWDLMHQSFVSPPPPRIDTSFTCILNNLITFMVLILLICKCTFTIMCRNSSPSFIFHENNSQLLFHTMSASGEPGLLSLRGQTCGKIPAKSPGSP